MGNCLFVCLGYENEAVITVIKSDGGVLEFYAPISAGCITRELPSHAVFPTRYSLDWKPLAHDHYLFPGESYYLLPLNLSEHAGSDNVPMASVPYRISLDVRKRLSMRSYVDVASGHYYGGCDPERRRRHEGNVFWKANLVIRPGQLREILSEEGSTVDLLESARAVAKHGTQAVSSSSGSSPWSSSPASDQWSLSTGKTTPSPPKEEFTGIFFYGRS